MHGNVFVMFFSGVIAKVNLGNIDDKEYILIPDAQRLDAITLFSPNTHEIIGNFTLFSPNTHEIIDNYSFALKFCN